MLKEGKDCSLCTILMVGLLGVVEGRGSSLAAAEGRTLRPGRPPTDGGFRSLAGCDCSSSWTAVEGRCVEVVEAETTEVVLETVEPWLCSRFRPEISRLSF